MATLKNTTTNTNSSIKLPVGSTANRPNSPALGMMRFNTSINTVEIYNGSSWRRMGYAKSVSLAGVPSTLNETTNRTATITVNAFGYPPGITFYWTVTGSTNSNDFVEGFSGTIPMTGNEAGSTGTIDIEIREDFTPEGTESFQIQLRRDSQSGTILTTSSTITIIDTSTVPPPEDWTGNIITATGQNGATSPNLCNIWFRRHIMYWVYTASEVRAAFNGKTSTIISRMRFEVIGEPANQPLPNYAIGMKQGSFSTASNPGNIGYTIVKNQASESFTTGTIKTFQFDTSFNWANEDLVIAVAWGQCPTTYNQSGVSATGGGGSLYFSRADSAGAYTINQDAGGQLQSYRPVVQLYG